jgi:hypothetical protein
VRRVRWLVARAHREAAGAGPWADARGSSGDDPAGALCGTGLRITEQVEARKLQRACLGRARDLWQDVIQGCHHGVAAMVVLGVLGGVEPLASIADRPPPRPDYLERVVERLADGWLDRRPIAVRANAALGPVAARLGRPIPAALAIPYVGVLAARFRRAILRPR